MARDLAVWRRCWRCTLAVVSCRPHARQQLLGAEIYPHLCGREHSVTMPRKQKGTRESNVEKLQVCTAISTARPSSGAFKPR
eukprot:1380843-Rhodomonas_salina.1